MGREVETIEPVPEPEAEPETEAIVVHLPIAPVELVAIPQAQPQFATAIAVAVPANTAQPEVTTAGRYRLTDLSGTSADPAQFYEFAYRNTLKSMIDAVVANA